VSYPDRTAIRYEHGYRVALLIERERSANSEDSRRLAALNVLAQLQLKLVLEKRAATPDKQVDPKVPAH
jgi:hypothetical protein